MLHERMMRVLCGYGAGKCGYDMDKCGYDAGMIRLLCGYDAAINMRG